MSDSKFVAFWMGVLFFGVCLIWGEETWSSHDRMNQKAIIDARWNSQFGHSEMVIKNFDQLMKNNGNRKLEKLKEATELKYKILEYLRYSGVYLNKVKGRFWNKAREDDEKNLDDARNLLDQIRKYTEELNSLILEPENAESPK